jgi:diguanylate cyclase (GGDEF)-like protein/PAS domain S-box-containing protein
MKLPDHSPPPSSIVPTPSLEEALDKNREVEGKLEICAGEIAVFNETAKMVAAGCNVLQVEKAHAQNKNIEDRMLAWAGDLHEVNEALEHGIDDREDRDRELKETGKKLSDTLEILAVAERTTAEEQERCRATLNHIADAVITTDIAGNVTYLNPVAEIMTGWASAEAEGHPLQEVFKILQPQAEENTPNPVELILRDKTHVGLALHTVLIQRSGNTFNIEDSATPLRDSQGKIIGAVLIFHDVTQAREMAAQITFQSSHDALTGLIDRREFERQLLLALLSGKQDSKQHTLLYLDIDNFKIINDSCGHIGGDELLKKITSILQGKLRTNDTLARVGGDEFGLLLEGCPTQPALRVAELLRQSVQEFNFIWKEKVFQLGISIGLVTFGNGSETLPDILQMADAACYLAKDKGRNRIQIYTVEDMEIAQRHGEMGWVGRIQKALKENRFVLYSQKILPLGTNCEEGEHYEMLLRMQDEDGNLVSPMVFIPAAERYGLMPQLDRWVITTAFAQYDRRHPPSKTTGTCAINLSGDSICDENFYEFVVAQFDRFKIPPTGICFEITETSAIANLGQATVLVGSRP